MNFAKKLDFLPEQLRTTVVMRAFGLFNVPLLFLTSPRVLAINDETCRVEIPFRKIVKNHLGSMYFGALAIGADTCVGMLAFEKIKRSKKPIHLVFKDFNAQFLKRAEGPTVFVCDSGVLIDKMISEALSTGERVSQPIPAKAFVGEEVVAEFALTLSLKLK